MAAILDREQIEAILPHRHPFLFVDRVTEIEEGKRIVGELDVDETLRYLASWTPPAHLPVSVLAEAMAQVGAILALYEERNRGKPIYFRAIDEAEFPMRVALGSVVRVEAIVRRMRARFGSLSVTATVNGALVGRGVMSFALG
ncbi:MAG TPA: 3-hydroxyacyl-[acyl-carrier-protein] dehydratase FabZ [Vicinamibacteria bacterium]|nr:3-hydroxyacyl-[acyl-carrier-protein] dehydratase FabZ [Vicinamibacteria bacterium]